MNIRKERTMANEMTQSNNELREQDRKQDYSQYYDRLKSEYKHPLADEERFSDRPILSKEDVIENVEHYGWRLAEGRGGHITVFQSNGRILHGSPPPMPLVNSPDPYNDELLRVRQSLFDLNRQMEHDVAWIANLMGKVNKGDIQAMRLYAEIFIIPKPVRGPSLSAKNINVSYNNKSDEPTVRDV
jgi:hypothetical protein